jgi:hypothetical protein
LKYLFPQPVIEIRVFGLPALQVVIVLRKRKREHEETESNGVILGRVSRNCQKRLLASIFLLVCLSLAGWLVHLAARIEQLGSLSTDFHEILYWLMHLVARIEQLGSLPTDFHEILYWLVHLVAHIEQLGFLSKDFHEI